LRALLDAIEMIESVGVEDMQRLAIEDPAEAARIRALLVEAHDHVRLLGKHVRRAHLRVVK
jgi:hypothetical protein